MLSCAATRRTATAPTRARGCSLRIGTRVPKVGASAAELGCHGDRTDFCFVCLLSGLSAVASKLRGVLPLAEVGPESDILVFSFCFRGSGAWREQRSDTGCAGNGVNSDTQTLPFPGSYLAVFKSNLKFLARLPSNRRSGVFPGFRILFG